MLIVHTNPQRFLQKDPPYHKIWKPDPKRQLLIHKQNFRDKAIIDKWFKFPNVVYFMICVSEFTGTIQSLSLAFFVLWKDEQCGSMNTLLLNWSLMKGPCFLIPSTCILFIRNIRWIAHVFLTKTRLKKSCIEKCLISVPVVKVCSRNYRE